MHLLRSCVRPSSVLSSRRPIYSFVSQAMKARLAMSSLPSSPKAFEEEREDGFEDFYYPIVLGDVIREKYRVVAKLGFGSMSTVWCCRELQTKKFVALKIYGHESSADDSLDNESAIYHRLGSAGHPDHPGRAFVRTIQDTFTVRSRKGHLHRCLVHDVLANNLFDLRQMRSDRTLPVLFLKQILIHVLLALDFVHSECGIIHTDIKEENIILNIGSRSSLLDDLDKPEIATASLYTTTNKGYNIYRTAQFGIPTAHEMGRPTLCDFSLARFGPLPQHGDIQPDPYRAPEVILEMPWSYPVDVWNVGVMIWDMFTNQHLFNGHDPETGKYENRFHLASIVALLGPPPLDFLQRSEWSSVYFDEIGHWKCTNAITPLAWDGHETNLTGADKVAFLNFVRRMVKWAPEERATAAELLEDRWLVGDVS